jgi:hypothetical protein
MIRERYTSVAIVAINDILLDTHLNTTYERTHQCDVHLMVEAL